ncbi:hypothetical protein [Niabella drilacis]|uniref:YD repeat-containing protein n=1 Tax=Niabella drilacis (strain DSM 25811 / CCM 8410 / CCUG 62505 / LMG 26954 / E90) TaxID=1285928 RepID=A0A1G6WIN0_NIADE|nr:hypothetical protein [Niabella drilacis]SDD65810.1 hypothetical protein SAMN04487894_111149 [Niabella drilacis]
MNTSIARLFVIATLLLCASCTKNNTPKQPEVHYENERIKTLTLDVSQKMVADYSYDEEKRLKRIDYNYPDGGPQSSLRLEYAPQSISAKFYKGAAPDPLKESYLFTLLNGKVATTTVNKANGSRMDFYYEYDNKDRISEIGVRNISANGSLSMSADIYLSYTAETQTLRYYGKLGATATDSIIETRTHYADAEFFSLANIGFNYFGTVSTGLDYKIAGMYDLSIPFPFFKPLVLVEPGHPSLTPAPFPLQKMAREGKARDMDNAQGNGWMQVSQSSEFPFAASYRYDDKNRLIQALSYAFTWY